MARAVPDFWERRLTQLDVRHLCDRAGVDVRVVKMPASAAMPPMMFGRRQLFLSTYLPPPARPFVILHELTHLAAGHADELTALELDETRYPVEDRIADGVAAIGVTTPRDRELPVEALADLLRTIVPVPSRAWQVHRAAAVAEVIREQVDLGRWGAVSEGGNRPA